MESDLKEDNKRLINELSTLTNRLSELDGDLKCQRSTSLTTERELRTKVADLQAQVSLLTDELKVWHRAVNVAIVVT